MKKFLIAIEVLILIFSVELISQTRSKIQGKVTDARTGEALIGVNILLLNTTLGAATNIEGRFTIINVPVGTYTLQASMVGFNKERIMGVLVSADRTTTLDIELSSSVFTGEEVIVIAEKNKLHNEVSNTQLVVTEDQINNTAGIRDINAFLEKQPGVSSEKGFLEIRGGSAQELNIKKGDQIKLLV